MDALGVAPRVTGTLVSDFWGPYLSLPSPNTFCNAHILRELTVLAEFDRQLWPGEIIAFLLDLKEKTASLTSLATENERLEILGCFQALLSWGWEEAGRPQPRNIRSPAGSGPQKETGSSSPSRAIPEPSENVPATSGRG